MLRQWGARTTGHGGISPPPHTHTYVEIGHQIPITTPNLYARVADLRERIMKSWGNPAPSITETNRLIYAAATVVLEMLDDLLSECLRQLKPSKEKEPEGLS